MTIGERITNLRHKKGWTRRVLAMMTGYTEQTIIAWETDKNKPSERAIRALEKAFGQKLRA